MRLKLTAAAIAGAVLLMTWPLGQRAAPYRLDSAASLAAKRAEQCPLQARQPQDQVGAVGTITGAADALGSLVSASPLGCLARSLFGQDPAQAVRRSPGAQQASCPLRRGTDQAALWRR